VARAVNPTVTRFAAEKVDLSMEIEPATFIVMARGEIKR
jgi:hypothetical protein